MVRIRAACALCFLLAISAPLAAQPAASDRKHARAAQVAPGALRLDGRLDEPEWQRATPVTDFTQKEPTEGAAPTDEMDVRFLFDGTAVYVGARMFTRNVGDVQAPLGRRDNAGQAEHIQVWFDTFLDRRTAAMFGVTAAGVRLDRLYNSDNEDSGDSGYDPVWEARVAQGADSWTAELWIPFSQLRFNPQLDQTWGLNIRRFRPTLDEEDYWVLVPRTERVFISRFGNLDGIAIRPPRRIELLPYAAGSSTMNGGRDPANPFDDGRNLQGRVGGDAKVGLGPNLTLDATINPDFAQVEADPAEVNLTAFETRFPERRPFFLEGAQLFSISHPNFYYSRRIGARPRGTATGDFVEYPQDSTIVVASKLTGRLPSKTSVGVLAAVTGEEVAHTFDLDTSDLADVRVAPRSFYGLGRVRQDFGALGSTVGFIVNAMHRDLASDDPLASLLSRNAVAGAGDTLLRFKGGEYEFQGVFGGSYVSGEAPAIERIQRSSAHYAQRPDRTYSPLDPTLTALGGWSLQSRFDRTSGRHWLWGVNVKADSENFETNDIANLNGADGLLYGANLRYRETLPNRWFRNYSIALSYSKDGTLRGLAQSESIRPSVSLTWANYWTTNVSIGHNFETRSVSLTRGGSLMRGPAGWSASLNVGNRSTSNTRLSSSVSYSSNEAGGESFRTNVAVSVRPGPRWQLSANPSWDWTTEAQQYVSTVPGGRAETYDRRYVFGVIDRSTVATEFRMSYTFKPDLNLDIYAEPFAASGRYFDFYELLTPDTRDRLVYGVEPNTGIVTNEDGTRTVTVDGSTFTLRTRDFNSLSFRSNVVLRWEWRPGSTLYVVWQADRANTENRGSHVNLGDMFNSITAPGSNYFIVKTSFWIPVG